MPANPGPALGYVALVLHAHLPFVRHPEHERFLEESWLYEAIAESYLPLLEVLRGWKKDALHAQLTLSLSPTLCAMLRDPLLKGRFERRLEALVDLAEKEVFRTHWDQSLRPLAERYSTRFQSALKTWRGCQGDLVAAFAELQQSGQIEILTCAATHALLPLLAQHPPSLRAQILTARDDYRACFGQDPRGIWLPECAYVPEVEPVLQEANLRWFITDTHGLLNANPSPKFGAFAPIYTPRGVAAFARDSESAKQVWSRHGGYPGDPRYRDFYRDIGFDLDLEYVEPCLPSPGHRGFTGIKYYRITGGAGEQQPYEPEAAGAATEAHARHFLESRASQIAPLAQLMDRPPLILAPYDAELFGHWWHEGLDFIDNVVRLAATTSPQLRFLSPTTYLRFHPTQQVARPGTSSWGENGFWGVWLNERNSWILPHLRVAQERMTNLARRFPAPSPLQRRALNQSAREVMLAQASDWPFILHTGTSPEYARGRVRDHLLRFLTLHEQLTTTGLNTAVLESMERQDNLFPDLNYRYWA